MVTISGHQDVHRNDEKCLLKALAHQPLRVAIDASAREFQFYSGDVFDGRCGGRFGPWCCWSWVWIKQRFRLYHCEKLLGTNMGRERLHQGEEEHWKTRGSQSIR